MPNLLDQFRVMYEDGENDQLSITEEDKKKYTQEELKLLEEQIKIQQRENYASMNEYYAKGGSPLSASKLAEVKNMKKENEPVSANILPDFNAYCGFCKQPLLRTEVNDYVVLSCLHCKHSIVLDFLKRPNVIERTDNDE